MRTAVITMVQARDFPAAWSGLSSLGELLGPDCVHHVLLNDVADDALLDRLAAHPRRRVYCDGRNLGVAGGRNRLISAAMDDGAEFVVSLEDDLLVPVDLVTELQAAHRRIVAGGGRPGLLCPAVLDYHSVADAIHTSAQQAAAEDGAGGHIGTSDETRRALRAQYPKGPPATAVYHMGIRDWEAHYLRVHGSVGQLVGAAQRSGEVRVDDAARRLLVADDPALLEVDTVPGGVCAFSADVVDEVGLLDEAYNPFGYEDADFAIRVHRSGRTNALVPTTAVLHDLQLRHKRRSRTRQLVSTARGRTLLVLRHGQREQRLLGAAHIGLMLLASVLRGRGASLRSVAADILAFGGGVLSALAQPLPGGDEPAWPVLAGGESVLEGTVGFPLLDTTIEVGYRIPVSREGGLLRIGGAHVNVDGRLILRWSADLRTDLAPVDALSCERFHLEVTDRGFLHWLLSHSRALPLRARLPRQVAQPLWLDNGGSAAGFDAAVCFDGPAVTVRDLRRSLFGVARPRVRFVPRYPSLR